jgi:hypothetical protein
MISINYINRFFVFVKIYMVRHQSKYYYYIYIYIYINKRIVEPVYISRVMNHYEDMSNASTKKD